MRWIICLVFISLGIGIVGCCDPGNAPEDAFGGINDLYSPPDDGGVK